MATIAFEELVNAVLVYQHPSVQPKPQPRGSRVRSRTTPTFRSGTKPPNLSVGVWRNSERLTVW